MLPCGRHQIEKLQMYTMFGRTAENIWYPARANMNYTSKDAAGRFSNVLTGVCVDIFKNNSMYIKVSFR